MGSPGSYLRNAILTLVVFLLAARILAQQTDVAPYSGMPCPPRITGLDGCHMGVGSSNAVITGWLAEEERTAARSHESSEEASRASSGGTFGVFHSPRLRAN